MRSPDSSSGAIDAVVGWARQKYVTDQVMVVSLEALAGGVSGARVDRVNLAVGRPGFGSDVTEIVVVKHTSRCEFDALVLLAELNEPAIPRLLASGHDGDSDWIVVSWFAGDPVGLVAELPPAVGDVMARIHRRFLTRPAEWPATFERIDSGFVEHALQVFLPATLERLPRTSRIEQFRARALSYADELTGDARFVATLDTFPATVLHGDLYGLNVLQTDSGDVMVIDWNTARIGPGMFDIAMGTSSPDSSLAKTYIAEWRRIGGPRRDLDVEFDWSATLINTMFAGAVAQRGSLSDAIAMLDTAAAARSRLHR